jgi:hypothetical protein
VFLLYALFLWGGACVLVAGIAFLATLLRAVTLVGHKVSWGSWIFMVVASGSFITIGGIILLKYIALVLSA